MFFEFLVMTSISISRVCAVAAFFAPTLPGLARPGLVHPLGSVRAMASSAASGHASEFLFIYGSLMSESVLQALIKRTPQIQPATLHGFHRFRIRNRPYPAIAPFSPGSASPVGAVVQGLLLCGLSEEEHALLDYFEDDEYVKQTVEVTICRSKHAVTAPGYLPQPADTSAFEGNTAQAFAYVYAHATDDLYGEWSIEKFLNSDVLPGYVDMTAKCREDYLVDRDFLK